MLYIAIAIFGLTNTIAFGQGGWFLQNNPTNYAGESMQFVSATEGWINLTSNALLHTTNGGVNWNVVIPNTTDVMTGYDAPGSRLSFLNDSTGWVIKTLGDGNNPLGVVLFKTTNSGSTWQRTVLSSTAGDAAIQVQFVDANNGWVLIFNMTTGTPIFLKTTNGGANWTSTNGGGIFYYVNATTGYAFSAAPNSTPPYTIYKTINGGTNWTSQYVDNTIGELNAIQFTDINNGWIIGRGGKIFHTTNGGTNWTQISNSGYNSNYKNNRLSFINNTTGWIASENETSGSHFTLSTTDTGTTWTTQLLPFNSKIYSIHFWDANNGWATTDSYNNNGIDYPGQIARYFYNSAGTYSNATLNGPWFFYRDVTPIDPFNDSLLYFIFDGNGNIIDLSGFGGPWFGSSYTVNSSGVLNGTITNGNESFSFGGLLNSTTEGMGFADGLNWRFHKIANPGALKDKIVGTLTTDDCGSRSVTLNINNNGIITSATGLAEPVFGRVYTDLGVYVGHMTTGEGVHWSELSIKGFYNNNILTGGLKLDADDITCVNGLSNLVRSDNLGINDISSDKKIVVYPNPNNGTFYMYLSNGVTEFQIEIYDIVGHKVFSSKQTTAEINFYTKTKGLYLLKVYDGVTIYKGKVIIE